MVAKDGNPGTDAQLKKPVVMPVRGAGAEFTRFRGDECLISGGRGTGKTWAILCWFIVLLQHYPGMRLLFCRKTRASMTDTTLVTWESILTIIGLGKVCEGAGRANRTSYVFPNGSEVIVKGLDEPQRLRSGGFDMAYLNEGVEATPDDWETITSSLRSVGMTGKTPWRMAVMDCNPDAPTHWIRKRVSSGSITEFVSVHKDNPAFWDRDKEEWTEEGKAYMAKLEKLTGVRRLRFLLGKWAAAEGAVFEESWEPKAHMADPDEVPELHQHVAGVDFGSRKAGVISVYGVDSDGGLWRVREIYRRRKGPYWWHEQAKRLKQDYPGITFICDGAEPSYIDQWNESGLWAVPSEKGDGSIKVGIGLIEAALAEQGNGRVGLRFVRGATGYYDDSGWSDGPEPYDPSELAEVARERTVMDEYREAGPVKHNNGPLGDWIPSICPLLEEANHPTGTEDEFYVYSWEKQKDGQIVKDVPRKEYDHGMDALRYVLRYLQIGGAGAGVDTEDLTPYGDPYVEAMLN